MKQGEDKWLEAFRKQVGNTDESVPEGLFDSVLGTVHRRRRNRRIAVGFGVVAAAAAAMLPFMLSGPQEETAPVLTAEVEAVESPAPEQAPESVVEAASVFWVSPASRAYSSVVPVAGEASEPVSSPAENAAVTPPSTPENTPRDAIKKDETPAAPEVKKIPEKDLYAGLFEDSETPVNTPSSRRKIHLALSVDPSGGGTAAEFLTNLKYVSSTIPDYYDRIMIILQENIQPILVEETDPSSGETKSTLVFDIKDKEELQKRLAILDEEKVAYKHQLPVNLRFVAAFPLIGRLSLETGLSYSLLHSSVFVAYSTAGMGQNIHLAGIPLDLRYDFLAGDTYSFYAKGGGMAEKSIRFTVGGEKNTPLKPWFWSTEATLGAQYRLSGPLWLFGEAGGSYHFVNSDTYLTIYEEKPLLFSVQAGLRLGL